MERLGEIEDLEFQPVFVLVPEAKPKIKYIPDFSYWIKGEKVAEDFKSAATRKDAVFRLKLRLWGWRGPCRLILTQAVKGGYSEEWLDKGRDPI